MQSASPVGPTSSLSCHRRFGTLSALLGVGGGVEERPPYRIHPGSLPTKMAYLHPLTAPPSPVLAAQFYGETGPECFWYSVTFELRPNTTDTRSVKFRKHKPH